MRLILIKLHLYLGLVGGALLCVVALTGALYAYEPQIRAWWGEPVSPATEETLLSPLEVEAILRNNGYTGDPVLFLWPSQKYLPLWVGWIDESGVRQDLQLDPITGERLPRAEQALAFFRFILDIHRTLTVGEPGTYIVGFSSLALMALSISGLFISVRRWKDAGRIWFPKRSERRTRVRRLQWRYWHRIIGSWTLPILLILPLTGMVWSFDSYANFIRSLGGPPRFPSAPEAPARVSVEAPLPVERVWRQALAAREGEGSMRVVLPTVATQPIRFEWSPPGAVSSAMRSRMYFDPTAGELLETQAWEDFSAGEQLARWAYPIHTGLVWGVFGQTLAFFGSLTVPFFFVTGLYLYLVRRRKRAAVSALNNVKSCTHLESTNSPSPTR